MIGRANQHTAYYNRKGHYSIIVQAVVDHQYRFTDVNIGWPGSVHDARVYKNSTLKGKCESGEYIHGVYRNVGGRLITPVLLGDAAYPLSSWLIKPFGGANLNARKEHFNYRMSHGRMTVENTFGRLKSRFRILSKRNDCTIETIKLMTGACCVLHNICEIQGDQFDERWLEQYMADEVAQVPVDAIRDHENNPDDVRNAFVQYFSENPLAN